MAVKSVSVLGSTGSVGTQTLELLTANREHYRVVALVAGRNARLLAAQALALRAEIAVINDPAGYAELRAALAGSGIEAACGPQAVVEAIFDHHEKRGFEPSEAEREVLLNL